MKQQANSDQVVQFSDAEELRETHENLERRLHARLAAVAPGRLVSEELIADRRIEAEAERARWAR